MLLQCLSGGGGGPSPPSKGAGGVPVYTCELCGQSMTHAYSMQRHRKQHMTEPKSFACEVCGRRYNRRDNLLVHVRTHFAA
ncbi:zinc finger protein, putative [Ixodes scapularis]|uniref:Zinc finger protein, putative n=2 Tax=Ixodes scapularis TaxID=6945 RepID=B7P2G5_IXOSC|nr:zinc finger protein, putative [Ixodes scapularis]|eukprot:XP_002402339.1 zinc finger protein, putative [Ixodes scapularis]